MDAEVKPPLFTLRGHNAGVTALAYCTISGVPYLTSGDEDGNLFVWNLSIFRLFIKYSNVVSSRIQSLKVVKLRIGLEKSDILVVQSRDNGILLIDLRHSITHYNPKPKILQSFATVESLFSRGDALDIDDDQAILAYPSCLDKCLVTIRILGDDARTQQSGTAKRVIEGNRKSCNVFDIILRKDQIDEYLVIVAYEDGFLSIFSFNLKITTPVPVLNSEGLKVSLIKNIDFGINDFISAYDLVQNKARDIVAVCGSPLNKLIIATNLLSLGSDITMNEINIKRQGTSAIAIRPDRKLFAAAGWDTIVRLYSMKSLVHLANINHHAKQVQSLLFIEKPTSDLFHDGISHLDYENKYLLCCASLEGTISISAIY